MRRGEYEFVWQRPAWPRWRYDAETLAGPLATTSRAQGLLAGRLAEIGFEQRARASLEALTDDAVKTSAIEGEVLAPASVRSSLARRLGIDIGALAPADRHIDGVVDMVLDATSNARASLTQTRLCRWHAALFPTGSSGLTKIRVGKLRDDATGPMQVVSGPASRRRVHYEAPPASRLPRELRHFLTWVNRDAKRPTTLDAGIAHLWLVTLHPFDDGNGRIARAVGDLVLTRADGDDLRFYSVSAQLQRERRDYYDILERTQRGGLDVTEWLEWFLGAVQRSLDHAGSTLDTVLRKTRFWRAFALASLNPRQVKVLNRLLDGFEGKLTSGKWATLTKCSGDTALRDLNQLVELGALRKAPEGGRSTAYELVVPRDPAQR